MKKLQIEWRWRGNVNSDAQITIATTVRESTYNIDWSVDINFTRNESLAVARSVVLLREDNVEVIEKLLAEARRMRDEGSTSAK